MKRHRFINQAPTATCSLLLLIVMMPISTNIFSAMISRPFVSSFTFSQSFLFRRNRIGILPQYSTKRGWVGSSSVAIQYFSHLQLQPQQHKFLQPQLRLFSVSSRKRKNVWKISSTRSDRNDNDNNNNPTSAANTNFRPGDKIQVEVTSFGPLGASVDVIGIGHGVDVPLLEPDEPPYATGLILQKEIAYFRSARGNVDVVRGEILPAYVQSIREVEISREDDDGGGDYDDDDSSPSPIKLDICLRSFGGKAKSEEVGAMILERLQATDIGILDIGEKSSPVEINHEFPGVSKSVFKKALGGLYKKGLVKPGPDSIELMKNS